MHPDFEKYNPLRSPSWRSDRVKKLLDQRPTVGKPDRVHDDDYIKDYRNFRLKWETKNQTIQNRLFRNNPGLCYAYFIRHHQDQSWRALLEARILAREPDEYVAMELHTIPEAIHYYERLYFNIRERLHSRSCIIKTVLGPSAASAAGYDESITDDMRHTTCKLFAYFGGSLVLDIMLSGFESGPFPQKVAKAHEFIDNAVKTTIQQRAAIAAKNFTVNKWTVMQLLEIQQRFMQSDAEARAASGGAGADYQANIEKFFESLPLAIGRAAAEGRSPEALFYETTGVEPRVSEQLLLVNGIIPDPLKNKAEFERPDVEEKDILENVNNSNE